VLLRFLLKLINKRVKELENELKLLANDYRKLEEEYKRYREEKEKKADRKKAVYLTNGEVKDIEEMLKTFEELHGDVSYKELKRIANYYCVSFRTIQRIALGKHKYSSNEFLVKLIKNRKGK